MVGGGSTNNLIRQLAVVSGQTWYCSQQHLWLRFLRRDSLTDRSNSWEDARRHDDRRILTKTGPTNLAASSATGSTSASAASAVGWQVQVGMTERGREDIGDITAIESLVNGASSQTTTNQQMTTKNIPMVNRDVALVQIQWEAHRITTADELYHTQWDTLVDTTTIRSPLTGRLTTMFVGDHNDHDPQDFDTEDPIFEICIDDEKKIDDATTTTNIHHLTIGNNNNSGDTDGDGSGFPELVDWKTYQQRIQNLERGKFYDEDLV